MNSHIFFQWNSCEGMFCTWESPWKTIAIWCLLGDSPNPPRQWICLKIARFFCGNRQPWSPADLGWTILPGERFFHGSNAIVKGPPWIPSRDTFDPLTSLTSKAAGRGSFVMEVGGSLTFPYTVYIHLVSPGTLNNLLFFGCFSWMTPNLYFGKWLFRNTSIQNWLFRVPGILSCLFIYTYIYIYWLWRLFRLNVRRFPVFRSGVRP